MATHGIEDALTYKTLGNEWGMLMQDRADGHEFAPDSYKKTWRLSHFDIAKPNQHDIEN